jgi:hypothetical protein
MFLYSLFYDHFSALVFSVHSLLAASFGSSDPLSVHLAAVAAFPPSRNRGARSARSGKGASDAARAPLERSVQAIESLIAGLLQLGVFRLGFDQNGYVGIGIFPQCEEVLVRSFGLSVVSGFAIGSSNLQLG